MASARMPPTGDTPIAEEARQALKRLAHARQQIGEVFLKLDAYSDDTTALATDLGVANGGTARDLFRKADRELSGLFEEQVNQNAQGNARALMDRMG